MSDDREVLAGTDGMQQATNELEQRTEDALRNAWDSGVSEEDLRLLCFHCGIRFEHVIRQAPVRN